jgi:hypothetical protein
MKFFIGSITVIFGIYVFAGAKEAIGAGVIWLVYTGISFLSGDIRVKKGEIDVPNWKNAKQDQLDGLA